ncbi:type II toxin-antitoxin system VapC family toxin [Ghiorsea bivora]|uniref:type II toxin-antitoxin system VapC family toxin n=1 Tax=Ghiorsea bivora TaxID=1485545 RepID=UPI000570CED3|nr:type II toxin-antitoxin system VapC family toxin [Ghiorsea bivora]
MSYLLDTNVLSELVRPKPSESVLAWFADVPDESLFISALTIGEIRKGVEGVPDARRKEKLRVWLEHELPEWFGKRVLSIDVHVAERWGRLQAQAKRPVPAIDSLLAATALHHELRMVTRNENDFDYQGLEVINPWES